MSKVRLKRHDDRDQPSRAEIASILISVLLTVALFGYVVFKAVTAPGGPVLVVEQVDVKETEEGFEVKVLLRNEGSVGVDTVDVEIPCDEPPVGISFHHVPAGGERTAILVCPPDAEDLQPRVVAWVTT